MNLPFPVLKPKFVDSKWFNADSPCDDETELATMDQIYQTWISSVGQHYSKVVPLGKTEPEQMEEDAETDEEEGNDESDESEDSHDEDEEEELRTSYSPPPRNNNDNLEHDHTMIISSDITDTSVIAPGNGWDDELD